MNVSIDNRHGYRIDPTPEERHAIDLYAEGFSAPAICRATSFTSRPRVSEMLRYFGIPIRQYPDQSNQPRMLTDAQLLAPGPGEWDIDDILTVSERRTRRVEREVAATRAYEEARRAAA